MKFNVKLNKERLFWVLNTGGWGVFALVYFILYGPEKHSSLDLIKFFNSNFLIGFCVSIGLRWFLSRIPRKGTNIIRLSIIIVLSSLITAIAWYCIDIVLTLIIYRTSLSIWLENITIFRIVRTIFGLSTICLSWNTLYFVINLAFDWQKEQVEKEKALRLANEAKMQMLQNQINPHFLFNSLNSISALIDENPTKAKIIIDELSDFLRFTLVNRSSHLIPFGEEIKSIEHFLQIQKIRFEKKLNIEFNIDPTTISFPIPSSILYPIVENAIKHGMNTSNFPLKVTISSSNMNNKLVVSIKNSGSWLNNSGDRNTNTGLENVRERLNCEYEGLSKLEVIIKDSLVDVRLIIPKK